MDKIKGSAAECSGSSGPAARAVEDGSSEGWKKSSGRRSTTAGSNQAAERATAVSQMEDGGRITRERERGRVREREVSRVQLVVWTGGGTCAGVCVCEGEGEGEQ